MLKCSPVLQAGAGLAWLLAGTGPRSRGAKQGRQWADSTPPALGPHGGPQHAFGPLGLHHASPIDRWLVRLQAATVCTVHAPAMDPSLESSQYWQASLPATLGVAIVLVCTNFLKAAVRGKGKSHGFPTLITVGRDQAVDRRCVRHVPKNQACSFLGFNALHLYLLDLPSQAVCLHYLDYHQPFCCTKRACQLSTFRHGKSTIICWFAHV